MLHREFYVALCGFALGHIHDAGTAEDVVQDSFMSLWSARETLEDSNAAKAFLYTTVRNRCISLLRRRKTQEKDTGYVFSEEFLEAALIRSETHRILHNAIDSLPQQTRRIVRLSLEGLKNSEIGEQLNISENTVHTLKKSAYKKLRELLREHYYLLFGLIP